MLSPKSFALAVLVALGVAGGVVLAPTEAAAQGTCRCNNGCHANPGQCVQRSADSCEAGYAPFCSNRAGSCPMEGWVSCAGECMCIRIPGYDGGVPADSSTPMDVPRPPDATTPPPDALVSMDVPRPPDGPVSMDAPAPPMDSGVPCPDGIVVDGVCYNERCNYQTEIGWVCTTRGRTCRIVGDVPYCVPVCAGEMCPGGQYCDPVLGCRMGTPNCGTTMCAAGQVCHPTQGCVSDRCPSMMCPAGQICQLNACVPTGSLPDGGARGDGATGDGGNTGGRGGCGCRTVTSSSPRGDAAGLLALAFGGLAIGLVRRRRRRAS